MELRALLVFAESSHTGCKRRGWHSSFHSLLETQSLNFREKPDFDIHLFTSNECHLPASSDLRIHFQEGASFGERLENAIESMARLGYQGIVMVGSDCPDLEQAEIVQAFDLLRQHGAVLGPDHRGGCYLIGIHASDREKLQGITWQRNTDFQEIRHRFAETSPFELPVKIDLDTLADVHLLAASRSPFRTAARILLGAISPQVTSKSACVKPSVHKERIQWQLPPPHSSNLSDPFRID